MNSIQRIEVYPQPSAVMPPRWGRGDEGLFHLSAARGEWMIRGKFYQLQGGGFSQQALSQLAREVFFDPVAENAFLQDFAIAQVVDSPPDYVVEIAWRQGVTDNTGRVAEEAIKLVTAKSVQCGSGSLLLIKGALGADEVRALAKEYANELMAKIVVMDFKQFWHSGRFTKTVASQPPLATPEGYQVYDFTQPVQQLLQLSQQHIWALNQQELGAIQDYYRREGGSVERSSRGLPPHPSDVEIEILAQTWSEHCKHKIFSAQITYCESPLPAACPALGDKVINSLYRSYIQQATHTVIQERGLTWAISVFDDNAGIVRYSDQVDTAIKVETHNSPSALDPYGGALTGIVGVNRDILGVGLGARPIGNTNVLCFAPSSWPPVGQENALPQGVLAPRRLLAGVHRGIVDGGNKSGIPTVNGAIYFDYNYAGRPLVYCGTVGVLPSRSPSGRELSKKYHRPGDRVVLVGGRTGVDGIHGATFSSRQLDQTSPVTAVQIGDPLTQRRVTDFMLEAQARELFVSVTDNGAGGLSSSVGEMAEKTGGACIDLSLVPTKYPEIRPFELVVSESQERMTFAVSPKQLSAFMALAQSYDVEATDLGEFNASGFFELRYRESVVGLLSMDFLHGGLPQMKLSANFAGEYFKPFKEEVKRDVMGMELSQQVEQSLLCLLAAPNIASKEKWVRQYDHEVQAATIVKPFVGPSQEGPGDAGVLWLFPHGGRRTEAIAIGCGMHPRLSAFDTYLMAQYAVDEAVRNLICQGVDPLKIALVDNFSWPDPVAAPDNLEGKHRLGQLVRACEALYAMACAYGTPYVSGKDSMKNNFEGQLPSGERVNIAVPPTLLITALGYIADVEKIVTSDFKRPGDLIFLLSPLRAKGVGLKYSEWDRYFSCGNALRPPDYIDPPSSWQLYLKLHQAMQQGWLQSCHDISDGGLLCCLAECCFGRDLGAEVALSKDEDKLLGNCGGEGMQVLEQLFSERASRFIISVQAQHAPALQSALGEHLCYLGQVSGEDLLLQQASQTLFKGQVAELKRRWRSL